MKNDLRENKDCSSKVHTIINALIIVKMRMWNKGCEYMNSINVKCG